MPDTAADPLDLATPFATYATLFLEHLKVERRASPNTLRNYATSLSAFASFLAAHLARAPDGAALVALELRDFRAFLAARAREGLSPQTLKLDLSAIRSFYRFHARRYGLENDAVGMIRGPRAAARLPRPVAARDADAVIDAARAREGWEGLRDAALFTLLYGAGLRISEALGLRRADAPFADALLIRGKGGKERLAPVLSVVAEAVDAYLAACPYGASGTDPLFFSARGKALSARMVQRTMAGLRARIGLDATATPHALRHAFATSLLAAGGDLRAVQELLGHASIAATQRYTKIDAAQTLAAHKSAHPRS